MRGRCRLQPWNSLYFKAPQIDDLQQLWRRALKSRSVVLDADIDFSLSFLNASLDSSTVQSVQVSHCVCVCVCCWSPSLLCYKCVTQPVVGKRTAFYLLSEPISHITSLCCIHSCPEVRIPIFLLLLCLQSHSINHGKVALKDAGQVRTHMASTWQRAVLLLLLIDSGEWQEWVRGDPLEEQQTSASLVAPWPVLWKCLSDDGCLKMSACMCVCVFVCVREDLVCCNWSLAGHTDSWKATKTALHERWGMWKFVCVRERES